MLDATKTISIFQRQSDPKAFSAGDTIFAEGQFADFMYGILDGEVELLHEGQSLEILQAGDVFGVGALLDERTRPYTAIAKTDCKLAFLDQERFLFAVQETPVFALRVLKGYSDRLNRMARSCRVA
ncbi:MAG TPA: cyclic nucleotide-binding domain-containing protein [Crinalium sp.]|jgi:CRP-like cAMP-binding protein